MRQNPDSGVWELSQREISFIEARARELALLDLADPDSYAVEDWVGYADPRVVAEFIKTALHREPLVPPLREAINYIREKFIEDNLQEYCDKALDEFQNPEVVDY